MGKKDKKDKDEAKKSKGKRGKQSRRRKGKGDESEALVRDNWLYYSEGPLTFLIAVLLVLCVLDTLLAGYALVYTKRIERENRAIQEEAAIRGPVNGTTWFLRPDGTYVHADGSIAGGSTATASEPQLPQTAPDAADTGEAAEGADAEPTGSEGAPDGAPSPAADSEENEQSAAQAT